MRYFINIPCIPSRCIDKMNMIESAAIKKNDKLYYGYVVFNADWKKLLGENDDNYIDKVFDVLILQDGRILNHLPGIAIDKKIKWIEFTYNQLLLIDSGYQNGSIKQFKCIHDNDELLCYSEISGRLVLKNDVIDKIIINAHHENYDPQDPEIILPLNDLSFAESEYIFHTHPQPSKKRRKGGIVYEFPSGSDLFHFSKFYRPGSKTIGSFLITPEGLYLMRPRIYGEAINMITTDIKTIDMELLEIESLAFEKYGDFDSDTFYQEIIHDYQFIDILNKIIKPLNLRIDYFPRIPIYVGGTEGSIDHVARGEKIQWSLQPFYLPKV